MADTATQHIEKLPTYWKQNHAFPMMTKLCEVVGLSSTASVFDLVGRLKDAGFVARVEGRIAPTKLGGIVVAVVDGQVTVKYLRRQPNGRFYLQPANAAFADILPEGELEILGVVVGSFRSYRR